MTVNSSTCSSPTKSKLRSKVAPSSLANYMNGCSLSLPYSNDKITMGIMLNGITYQDDQLLEIGSDIEKVLSK